MSIVEFVYRTFSSRVLMTHHLTILIVFDGARMKTIQPSLKLPVRIAVANHGKHSDETIM